MAAAILALAACSKESPLAPDNDIVRENGIDASELVFNISVENGDAAQTKGVKSAWEQSSETCLPLTSYKYSLI